MFFSLKNKKILITAGPTREFADPVRFLSNPSSGRIGVELAKAFRKRGARVTLVLGPTALVPPKGISVVPVVSARDMQRAVGRHLPSSHVFVAAAAVSDWRFEKTQRQKMKKGKQGALRVTLVKNPDILAGAGGFKKKKGGLFPVLVGFSLETKNIRSHAQTKLRAKNLDMIVGNTPESFGPGAVRATVLERAGAVHRWPRLSKQALAARLVKHLERWISHEQQNGR